VAYLNGVTTFRRLRAILAFVFVVAVAAALALAAINARALLDRLAPFDLAAPPDWATGLHLYLLRGDPKACFAALDRGKVDYALAPVRPIVNGCGYEDGAVLRHSEVSYGGGVLLRCGALVPLLLWQRHAVEPAALQAFGTRVTAIRSYGTYSCRNINHARSGRRSQHASANAIDVAGFVLADGTRISIARDWNDAGARGRFLHAVRDGACRFFGVVLSPDYNALHHDHFHLDASYWHACR
jgi:hypothetical protein